MGKRAKKVTLKKMAKPKLERVFSCPLCSHEKCIECKMDRQRLVGTAKCRVCAGGYQTLITGLSDPIDVYSEWVDVIAERDRVNGGGSIKKSNSSSSSVEKAQKGLVLMPYKEKEDHSSESEFEKIDVSEKKKETKQDSGSEERVDSEKEIKNKQTEEPRKDKEEANDESDEEFLQMLKGERKEGSSPYSSSKHPKRGVVESEDEE